VCVRVSDGDEAGSETEIPLPNVKNQALVKVIEFAKHAVEEPMPEIEKVRRPRRRAWPAASPPVSYRSH
jgi:hypothetical protein